MTGSNPFLKISPEEIEAAALLHGFKRKGQRLLPAPNLASYNGLIFLSMDADAYRRRTDKRRTHPPASGT